MTRRKIAAGNWKMNGLSASVAELKSLTNLNFDCDVILCPPATLISGFSAAAAGSSIAIGAQDCHPAPSGAHTGDLSAEMLKDAGASAVIVGHSERRQDHAETDETVRTKAEAAWRAGLLAIICVGETEAERDAGQALEIVRSQIRGSLPDGATAANTVVAYEPVWAIGTGRVPSPEDIAEMHGDIRETLSSLVGEESNDLRVLYGGSVKPGNAAEIFAIDNVDGGLVGGASLKAVDFAQIISAAG
ncbi:MAG: triose-phosphate isomerase [Pseudomonadota bacterium]